MGIVFVLYFIYTFI